ncbi:MAG TPA: hypothetical protein VHE54_00020 [Puia sp.]|nr:hypothetical protein [Puia sp.]
MDKVFQILIVFGLVTLLIHRFIRGKGPQYLPYDFLVRLRPPLSAAVEQRLDPADPVDAEGFELEKDDLLFSYRMTGSLTIFRRRPQGGKREMQELAVPIDCTAMAIDPTTDKLYFEAGGYWFVYGTERGTGEV